MVSGAPLFIALFNNLAIFIALVAVYGTLVSSFQRSAGPSRQLALGAAFGLFVLGCMNAKIPVASGVIVDQRNAIVALSGAFGGPVSALITAAIAAAYRAYLGGSGILSGITGIGLAALAGMGLRRWLSPIDTVRKAALGALIATLVIVPGFLLAGPLSHGLALTRAMALPYGTAIFLAIFLVGLLLNREDHRIKIENRFRTMVETAPDAIVVLDEARRIHLMNAKASELSGIPARRALGRCLWDLGWFSAEARRALQEHLDGLSRNETSTEPFELPASQGKHTLEANVVLLSPLFGQPEWLLVLHDVSERKRAEEARAHFEARISRSKSLEALGRLAGGVAHDFNNMLTVILTAVDMARSGKRPEDAEELNRIANAATEAAKLTAHLLAFGRKQPLAPEVLSPNRVIEGVVPLLKHSLPENIELELQGDPNVANVIVDGGRLEQVIVNLAVNARDAMPSGGRLTIATCNRDLDDAYAAEHPEVVPGRYVEVSVRDTGVGMSEEIKARIFEPFYTTKGVGKGTGLGLATVHGIVRQSGGHVSVHSEPGHGSCFRICLPATSRAQTSGPEVLRVQHTEKLSGHVLLVEDNELVRKPVARMLTSMGLSVTEANGGQAALAALAAATAPFDVVLTDVVMRDLSGPELAKRIVEQRPSIRVLYMSGYTEETMISKGALASDVHFIAKPFTRSELQKAIQELLAGSGPAGPRSSTSES